jgi:long-chain acyl-CoA synthetase
MADLIPHRFLDQARRRGTAPAYLVRDGTSWVSTPWTDYVAEARRAAKALIALGFERGGTVSILGFNRPEWTILQHGAMLAGGACAGVYTTCSADEVRYIVDHAESSLVLVEDPGQLAKIRAERAGMPKLRHIVQMRGAPPVDDALSWEDFLARGDAVPEADLDARVAAIGPDDLAVLIYTSGTTGPPKAVMLSHSNTTWTTAVACEMIGLSADDQMLSYLPLSHIAEQTFTVYGPAIAGTPIAFARSMNDLPEDLKEVRPTVFFGVPRVWEKFQAGIVAKVGGAPPVRQALFRWATRVGKARELAVLAGRSPGLFTSVQHRLADRLVLSKVRAAIGLDRCRVGISGAAPIGLETLEFLAGLGLVVREVYGQSEDCGPTSFNRPDRTRLGTVGPPFPGVEVRIADDGEILVNGPNVFLGYLKNPEATAETLVDGWLYSGDLGTIEDGFLRITGRKKDILITAGGKNIAPLNIEAALKESPLIGEAVLIGDRRHFLSALLFLDMEQGVAKWAATAGVPLDAAATSPALRAELQAHVDAVNSRFARVEHVRKFTVIGRALTIASGELTPTLKVKRKVVGDHFATEIEAMYTEG